MKFMDFQYPIGKFIKPESITKQDLGNWIEIIENFPEELAKELENASDEILDSVYRAGGWTVRQVVHHLADSHMNAFVRFKLALTEETPIIKPYEESLWAELEDGKSSPISSSLELLKGLHFRWFSLAKVLDSTQLKRKFIHPEHGAEFTLEEVLGIYAWHCKHHLAHIKLVTGSWS